PARLHAWRAGDDGCAFPLRSARGESAGARVPARSLRDAHALPFFAPMINGNDAIVEEFVLHRLATDDVPSIFNDYSAVLQGAEEQEFPRRLFLKAFGNAGETFTFADGEEGDVFHGLCAGIRAGRDLVEASQSIAQRMLEVLRQHDIKGGDCFVVKFSGVG